MSAKDSSFALAVWALATQAMRDGVAVVPVEVLFALFADGPRPAPERHEITFPGPTPTWSMRHPASCPRIGCEHARVALRQFPPHDGCFAPGEYVAELDATNHLITTAKD